MRNPAISWRRYGGRVIGVDFSKKPIKKTEPRKKPDVSRETIDIREIIEVDVLDLICIACAFGWVEEIPSNMRISQIECPECLTPGCCVRQD